MIQKSHNFSFELKKYPQAFDVTQKTLKNV